MNGLERSLAIELASEGYDVWLTNNRGTYQSNEHLKYTVKDKEYWNFTFHDFAMHDVPANVHYIREKTGHDQVIYIGHSQGTT